VRRKSLKIKDLRKNYFLGKLKNKLFSVSSEKKDKTGKIFKMEKLGKAEKLFQKNQ